MSFTPAIWTVEPDEGNNSKNVPYYAEYAGQAYRLALVGCKNAEIAAAFGITVARLEKWCDAFPDFAARIRDGGLIADGNVAHALYRRAVGYERMSYKIFNHNGIPIYAQFLEIIDPDPAAAQAWLKNRRPSDWAQAEKREISGPGGGPMQMQARTMHVEFVDTPNPTPDRPVPAPQYVPPIDRGPPPDPEVAIPTVYPPGVVFGD